jgi:hypothetical protein
MTHHPPRSVISSVKVREMAAVLLHYVVECEVVFMYHECMRLLGKLLHLNSPDVLCLRKVSLVLIG